MSELKFIKLSTKMFDDEKIKIIESMPDGDSLLVIWVKLLVQAAKTNAGGFIFLNENVPYTEEMLSTIFNKSTSSINYAMSVFESFGMIERNNGLIEIANWHKHQNVVSMDKIREDTKKRVANYRERQKLKNENDKIEECNGVTQNVTLRNEQERRKKKEEIRSKNKIFNLKDYGFSPELESYIKEFFEMRNKKKKPLTDEAKRRRMNELIKLSDNEEERIKIVIQTVDKCYDQFYPLIGGSFSGESRGHVKEAVQSKYDF